jgi:ABC-type nickel/cobalt efflux system permease component RcnA
MTPLVDLLRQGPAHAWLFIPSAILLGALHGLEPGHSKTMMAAFIIAIRGTVVQAVLLGLAATVSHTAVVWLVALAGLHFGQQWGAETSEPYFQILSAVVICGIAVWMLLRARRARLHGHHHDHEDAHTQAHADDIRRRVARGNITTPQIVMVGLTGGLIPCPAAITILLLCLQLRQFSLGVALVLCFSIGLAITLVGFGVIAALGVRHVSHRWSAFEAFARRAPYASGVLIICVGLYIGAQGVLALQGS